MRTPSEIQRIDYAPPDNCDLDLEVISFADLKARTTVAHLSAPLSMNFYHFIGITEGCCQHVIDFVPHDCPTGTWILLRPGQVHSFDTRSRWNGVTVLFKSEFLMPLLTSRLNAELKVYGELDQFPNLISLDATAHETCVACINQIGKDARLEVSVDVRHALLRHQLYSVLLRLNIALQTEKVETSAAGLQRFKRFQQLLETHFAEWHQIADYTNLLGCSAKTLNRATLEVMGMCAKSYISQRIALEAKRILAHTDLPVSAISTQLGFDETTNFVKFFKREVLCTPTEFRRQQQGR